MKRAPLPGLDLGGSGDAGAAEASVVPNEPTHVVSTVVLPSARARTAEPTTTRR